MGNGKMDDGSTDELITFQSKIKKISPYSAQGETSESPAKNDSSENKKKDSLEKEEQKEKAESKQEEQWTNFSSLIAAHYNFTPNSFDKRNSSRIYYLRNFNNWIKSLLIKKAVSQTQGYSQRNLKVLDMCCGKGGDLFKWAMLNIRYMVCTDIAELSLEHYKSRYNDYIEKCQRNRKHCNLECEFIPADCTRVRLRGKYHDPSIQFDIVSCQFSFHYCFESLPQAECMLKNASECLKPGGLFIGTIANSYEIVKRLRQSETNSFKNDVFSLEMCCSEPYPLFGAKYNFHLEGVVNCPEFLVHFPTFLKLAGKFGFELVEKAKFPDFFEKGKKTREGEMLLRKMKALETYQASADGKLVGPFNDYTHADIYCKDRNVRQVGTLSKSEWDVISLYQTFILRKVPKND